MRKLRLWLAGRLSRLPGALKSSLVSRLGGRLLRGVACDDPELLGLQTNLGVCAGAPFRFPGGFASAQHWFGHALDHGGDAGALRTLDALAPGHEGLLDVGAHLGVYAFALACRHAHLQVHAFEPTARLLAALHANVDGGAALGARVHVHGEAVAATSGEVSFHVVPGDGQYSSLVDGHPDGVKVTVPAITLDDFVRDHALDPSRWLLKVDVENAEPQVIAGARQTLSAVPAMVIELLGPARSAGLVAQLIAEFGFSAWYIADRELREKRFDDGDYVTGQYNWLFTRLPAARLRQLLAGSGVSVVQGAMQP